MTTTPDPVIALLSFFGISILGWISWKIYVIYLASGSQFDQRKRLVEDVLKQLYHVEYGGRFASLNEMSGALKLTGKRLMLVIDQMTKLSLITLDHDLITLTKEGQAYALQIVRTHRLWEKYLSEKTGYDKSEWHDRAERAEHKLSSEETTRLYKELGEPRFDPHGDPIPTEEGEILEKEWVPLSRLGAGNRARIVHIEDEPQIIYKQIVDHKLHIGSHLEILKSEPDKIKFFCEGKKYSLSPIVASNISVKALSGQEKYEENAIRLSRLKVGEKGRVLGISAECRGAARRRLLDLGFTPGASISPAFESPMVEPKAFSIRNTLIALRKDQADLILIEREDL